MGIRCKTGTKYLNRRNGRINTSSGTIEAGYVINAAGLYADRIARDFGFARHYKILPFKGLYLYSDLPPETLRLHVYPVPDLNYPFLGVHFTIAIDGRIKIGPTAIPAFWRENYTGLSNFNLGEFMEIMFSELNLLLNSNFDFKKMALTEIKKYYRPFLVQQASYLLEGVKPENYTKWGKPGIRAQLLDTRKKKLVMDFCLEGDEKSFHVLNAVSPAFTASMAFADHICREIEKRIQ
jgi:L-2-hydroxyglutarate oxidase LhgO